MLHPLLKKDVISIQFLIEKHRMPFKLFETGRSVERHQALLHKGATQNVLSRHLYDVNSAVPLYATAVDYVYFDNRWSWNLRDFSIAAWYNLFGNIVLDVCQDLQWGGTNRKHQNFTHFQLKENCIIENLDNFPCVLP